MIRFERKDLGDGASEVLTICKLYSGTRLVDCLGAETPFVVQLGDELYDLDGDKIGGPHGLSWEIADDVPAAVVEAIQDGWSSGDHTLTRIQ